MTESKQERSVTGELKLQAGILGGLVVLLWLVEVADLLFFGGGLDGFGIRPRTVSGLAGIAAAPFLHGGLAHLAANTVPLIVLAWLVMIRETWHLAAVSAIVVALGGLCVWAIGGSATVHIGASGLVFGLFGYLLLAGWFERRFATIAISVIVLLTYGGLLLGVLPGQPGVSWESHLFGFLAGGLSARILARPKKVSPPA